jgi:hypothetical protein
MWSIWRERNRRIFEDSESNVLLLKSSLRSLLDWALAHVPTFSLGNLVDLICFLDCNNSLFLVLLFLLYSSYFFGALVFLYTLRVRGFSSFFNKTYYFS